MCSGFFIIIFPKDPSYSPRCDLGDYFQLLFNVTLTIVTKVNNTDIRNLLSIRASLHSSQKILESPTSFIKIRKLTLHFDGQGQHLVTYKILYIAY